MLTVFQRNSSGGVEGEKEAKTVAEVRGERDRERGEEGTT